MHDNPLQSLAAYSRYMTELLDLRHGYRIYYGLADETVVLLRGGGDKRLQRRDIQEAKQLWQEFQDHHAD